MNAIYEHVLEQFRHLCNAPNSVRFKQILGNRFIRHAALGGILNHMEFLIKQPRVTRASGLIVEADSGNGKSSLARWVQRKYNHGKTGPREVPATPVIVIDVSEARDARALYNRVMEAMGIPMNPLMRVADREQYAIRLLRQAQARLLIVDEFQDVLKITQRQQRTALDTIKYLMNQLSLPVCAMGVGGTIDAMRGDPHLATRFECKRLSQWVFGNALCDFLASLEATFPLRNPSHLASPKMAKLIVERSDGNLTKMTKMLTYSAIFGILSGSERIDIAALDRQALELVPPADILALGCDGRNEENPYDPD